MESIINTYPPNIQQIQSIFPVTENQVFAYYPNIYNPSGKEIESHLKLHENIHLEQQKKLGVDAWWYKYITDTKFRLEQEIMAFAAQYAFIRRTMTNDTSKKALHDFSVSLSSELYGNIIGKSKAETLIRLKAKSYEKENEQIRQT